MSYHIIMAISVKKRKKRLVLFFIIISAFFIALAVYCCNVIIPIIRVYAAEKIKGKTISAINGAISNVIASTSNYVDILTITYDGENTVSAMSLKSSVINNIAHESIRATQNVMSDVCYGGVDIPLGTLSGIACFFDRGPLVRIAVSAIGNVESGLRANFSECGINQTNYRLYLEITAFVTLIYPGVDNVIEVTDEILLVETVIVGKIPSTYLNATNPEDMMDLIP